MVIEVRGPSGVSERRHWSTVDLWSDRQHRPVYGEQPLTAAEENRLNALRHAGVGVDIPLALSADSAHIAAGAAEHADLLAYLASADRSGWSYHFARLACSFKEGKGEYFTGADLTVELFGDGDDEMRPTIWSLTPAKVLDGDERSHEFGFTSSLKFLQVSTTRHRKAPQGKLVQGYGMLTSMARWEFTPTAVARLDGDFELGLIVRVPRDVPAHAVVTLNIVVEKPRKLAMNRKAAVRGAASRTIVFEGPGQPARSHSGPPR
ncbi:hypothetical protein ACWD4O_35545 [Streptomyces sp. NPDC002623]